MTMMQFSHGCSEPVPQEVLPHLLVRPFLNNHTRTLRARAHTQDQAMLDMLRKFDVDVLHRHLKNLLLSAPPRNTYLTR